MMEHTCNPRTSEAEARRFKGQPRLHCEPVSKKKKKPHHCVGYFHTLCLTTCQKQLKEEKTYSVFLSGAISPPWQGMHDANGRTICVAGKWDRRVRQRLLIWLMIKKNTNLGWK